MIINDEYQVTTDGDANVMLMKKFEKKTEEGQPTEYGYKAIGYYPTLKSALKDWTRKELFSTELKDLKTVNDKLEEIHNIINNLNL